MIAGTSSSGTSRRGGDRTTGRILATNTSGLNAIRFGYESGVLHVYVAAHDRRTSYSVQANGARRACLRAILFRASRGLPAPSLDAAMRRLREFQAA